MHRPYIYPLIFVGTVCKKYFASLYPLLLDIKGKNHAVFAFGLQYSGDDVNLIYHSIIIRRTL